MKILKLMSFKQFIIQVLTHFHKIKYKVKLNSEVFNQLAKDNILFNNSGIVGIYEHFENHKNTIYNTLVTIQKCLRIAGKYNDLDEVKNSNSHSTCFHMLGVFGIKNFNIEKIVRDIYEFIISIINKDNLYITVHPEDTVFTTIWQNISPNIRIEQNKENFWSAGQKGLCGQCTEIIYCDSNRDIEIWNIVHITHKKDHNCMTLLEHDYIDTGGGLERLYMLKNNLLSIYQISEYQEIINQFKENKDIKIALDGVKSIDAICYNNIPISNNKQGYVLKKLIRRTLFVLHKNKIKISRFLHTSTHILTKYIQVLQIMLKEESSFQSCLNKLKQQAKTITEITEEKAIYLHETHGIHYYLLDFLAKELDIKIACDLKKVGERLLGKDTFTNHKSVINKFEKQFISTVLMYNLQQLTVKNFIILNEVKDIIQKKKKIQIDKIYYIIADRCNVYPRMGGQEPDAFVIKNLEQEIIFEGIDAYKEDQYILLKVKTVSQKFTDHIIIEINYTHRLKSSQNHSLTHIMSSILSTIVCEEIVQVASYIDINRSKFSFFSHNDLNIQQEKLEEIINKQLQTSKIRMAINHLSFSYAKHSFKTLSHKNYAPYVRVVTIYSDNFAIQSKEVCAGTHNVEFKKIKIHSLTSSHNKSIKNIEFRVIE